MIRKSLVFLLMLSSTAGLVRAATIIDPMNPDILYTGRWDFSSPNRPWAQAKASSVIVNFQGTSIAVDIEGNTSDYLRVIIDDNALGSSKLQLQNGLITLAYGLSDTTHKLELYKENDNGRLYLNSIHLDEGKNLASPPARPRHKIEFYGDSNQA